MAGGLRATGLRVSAIALVGVTWLSAGLFGLYILAYYGGTASDGALERWNDTLQGLYEANAPLATLGIGSHFLGGGVLLLLGPIQLIPWVRERSIAVHRWLGRLFVTAAAIAAVGGLTFTLLSGTIGGAVMDAGFGLYGSLMLLTAVQTVRYARARQFDAHRAWGIRLFALVVGSWLYRIEYGLWFSAFGEAGHTDSFNGAFDYFMAFAFYLPNLAVAELFIRARRRAGPLTEVLAIGVLSATTALLVVGTYFFTREFWGPEIARRFL